MYNVKAKLQRPRAFEFITKSLNSVLNIGTTVEPWLYEER